MKEQFFSCFISDRRQEIFDCIFCLLSSFLGRVGVAEIGRYKISRN